MSIELFKGRKLAVATKHRKEDVIVPVLQQLSVEVVVPDDFDTDPFGTFSGEVERTLTPLETARAKCLAACRQYGCTLAVASEGSFGPHPTLFFVPADEEILVLMDTENNIEIKVREVSTATNFSGAEIHTWEDAVAFAEKSLFPSHALILRSKKDDIRHIKKGIQSWDDLERYCMQLIQTHGAAFIETDMRAVYNPSRMKVIETAAHKLLEKILRTCPNCGLPGFDVTEVKPGLPCSWCGSPTASTLSYVYSCRRCNYLSEQLYPHNKTKEEPTFCNYCNP